MEYVNLGRSGLKVSRICLGCMSYGVPERGGHPWTLGEAQPPLHRQGARAGHQFLRHVQLVFRRHERGDRGPSARGDVAAGRRRDRDQGLLPGAERSQQSRPVAQGDLAGRSTPACAGSSTDYIDLYQIHRWDYATPIEEMLRALDDVVRAGKARYLGASSMFSWQFAQALYLADRHGWTRFIAMQNHYNLLYREEEREMIPFCEPNAWG